MSIPSLEGVSLGDSPPWGGGGGGIDIGGEGINIIFFLCNIRTAHITYHLGTGTTNRVIRCRRQLITANYVTIMYNNITCNNSRMVKKNHVH